jgi:hypothetical protein
LKPAVRTLFVAVGLLIFGVGLVSLVFPPLLTPFLGSSAGGGATPQQLPGSKSPGMGIASLGASFVGMVVGLTLASAGVAISGTASYPSVPDPRFSSRQRKVVLVGAFLVLGLPTVFALVLPLVPSLFLAGIPVLLLAVVGALMVLVGTSGGLQ